MAMVTEYDWESDTWTHEVPTERERWRLAVGEIAEKARAVLPAAVNGRIESAVKLVLVGDVHFLEDGSVQVGSSDPTRYYRLVGTACTCSDFVQGKAPQGWCKHRIAAGIQKRVQELLPPAPVAVETPVLAPEAPPARLPEAPASVNVRLTMGGREVQITLRDHDETRLLARLEALLERYPHTPTQSPERPEGWCGVHGVAMTLNQKNGKTWYSHKTPEGWCKGR